ncbi:MAG: MFS transporter [Rhodoferax sp.]|nr:MFS transporter [Rhodoferax sp.]
MTSATDTTSHWNWRAGLRYGAMGLPLTFVALPLYIHLPNHYAKEFGIPLSVLGALLLGARLVDAVIDPLLGRWCDGLLARSTRHALAWAGAACIALALGFVMLFFPPVRSEHALLAWVAVSLVWSYAAYSALSILHQAWGARLGGNEVYRSRVVAWREGMGLVGVILASIAPIALGFPATSALFSVAIGLGWWAWRYAPVPLPQSNSNLSPTYCAGQPSSLWLPLRRPGFRALLAVFIVNGIASAIPATLILFFIQDRLQAPDSSQAMFLGTYFACAAVAMPLWLRLVRRLGLARSWRLGMLLSVGVFLGAAQLGAGDTTAFWMVCALSGAALGSDLAIPAALLAGTVAGAGDGGRAEGAYFGWWNFATKFNLALAAGLALPLLAWWGYVPGTRSPAALQTLTVVYCLLPCGLKAIAALLLQTLIIRRSP